MVSRIIDNVDLDEVSVVLLADHANFILANIRDSGLTAAELKERLLKYGILIRDCSSFRGLGEYYIRIAVRTRRKNERLIKSLKEVLNDSKND